MVEQATTAEALVAVAAAGCVEEAEEETVEAVTGEGGRAAMVEVEAGREAGVIRLCWPEGAAERVTLGLPSESARKGPGGALAEAVAAPPGSVAASAGAATEAEAET